MYSYVYSVDAVDSTLTSTGTLLSTQGGYTTFTVISGTSSYIDATTFTTSSVETYTSGQTYTITDYTSGTTETCDYSATTSRQTSSSLQSNTSGSTYNYTTITHSTNGTHTVSESTLIATLSSTSETSYTQACGYNYFNTQSFSASTDYGGTRTRYTGSTIFHTPYSTHTVSSTEKEIVKAYADATSFTQSCDYSETTSLQTTSGSSNFGGYSQSTYISTEHGQYGTHTIISRTVEVASSNASQTRAYIYFSENTAGSSVTHNASTTATWDQPQSQTAINTQYAVGSSSSATNSVGLTLRTIYSTGFTDVTILGLQDTLSGVTDGNSIFYLKQISSVTSDVYYSTYSFTDASIYAEHNTSYYQAQVDRSSNSTAFYSSTIAVVYRTGADVVSGKKSYTTESYIQSFSSFTSGSSSSETTTSYSSTKQTTSLSNNSASVTTTSASTIFSANITSRSVSTTETLTTGSTAGSTTQTTTRTASAFSTTLTTITQTKGTLATSYGTLTVTHGLNWFTAYVRDNGEILVIPTRTDTSECPLSAVGFTTTAWSNETEIKTTSTGVSAGSGIYYTFGISSTFTTSKLSPQCATSENAFSISPWISSNYNSIENAYWFSRIGTSSSSYNPDLSVFSMSQYADTASTNTLNYTLNRGAYLMTFNSLNGSTSTSSLMTSYLTSSETGYARKIKMMTYVTFYPFSGLPQVFNFTTSNTVLKI